MREESVCANTSVKSNALWTSEIFAFWWVLFKCELPAPWGCQSSWDHLGQVLPRTKCLEDDGVQLKIRENIFSLNYRHTSFYWTLLYCTLQILHFLQTKGLRQSCVKHNSQCRFSNSICSLHVSHSLILAIFQTFVLLSYLLWRSVISDLWCHYYKKISDDSIF